MTLKSQTWFYRSKVDGTINHFKIGPVSQVSLADLNMAVAQGRKIPGDVLEHRDV